MGRTKSGVGVCPGRPAKQSHYSFFNTYYEYINTQSDNRISVLPSFDEDTLVGLAQVILVRKQFVPDFAKALLTSAIVYFILNPVGCLGTWT